MGSGRTVLDTERVQTILSVIVANCDEVTQEQKKVSAVLEEADTEAQGRTKMFTTLNNAFATAARASDEMSKTAEEILNQTRKFSQHLSDTATDDGILPVD